MTDPNAQVTDLPAGDASFEQFLASGRLPAWLPQLLTTLYDGQDPDTAARWGSRIVECCRSSSFLVAGAAESDEEHRMPGGGRVLDGPALSLAVVHDWQARTVIPLIAQGCYPAAREPAEQPDTGELRRMHARAAEGERFAEAEWRAAVEPVLQELYRHAYGYAEAYATAHASATAYARANNFSPDGAVRFADSYAGDSTGANRTAFAESNAIANAAVLAAAYASGDAQAYAEAYPFALLNACAHASANRSGPAADQAEDSDRAARRRAAYARLADGLADSLTRLG